MPAASYVRRRNKWTEEEVIAAIKEWVANYGEVPASTDFHPSDCMRSARISAARSQIWLARAERSKAGTYPWPRTVQILFGSWNKAIRAAGFEPRREAIPELTPTIKPSDALRSIDGYLRRAQMSNDPDERRDLLGKIAERALAAIDDESSTGSQPA